MTEFTYSGADENDVQYGPGRWEHYSLFLSPSAPTADAPLLISLPGGGWQPTPFQLYSRENGGFQLLQGGSDVEQAAIDHGMHVVRAMYPHSGSNLDLQVLPSRPFPQNVQSVGRLVQHLKGRAGELGLDKAKFCLKGVSAGGHLALLSQLIPVDVGLAPYHSTGLPLSTADYFQETESPRVRAVVDIGGPKDLCVIDPATAGGSAKVLFYSGPRYPDFKGLPTAKIKAASPYWWAQRKPAELASLAVFSNYTSTPSADPDLLVWGQELSGCTGVDDSIFGKAWKVWHDANIAAASKWRTYWGSATGSFPNTGGNVGLSGAALAAALVDWWTELGLIS